MPEFKMPKAQEAKLNNISLRLAYAKDIVEDKFQGVNDAISAFSKSLNAEIAAYNVILGEAKLFTQGVVAVAQAEFANKSEDWQNGDAGGDIAGWIDEWNSVDLDPLEEVEVESLDVPDLSHSDDLDNLGSEP